MMKNKKDNIAEYILYLWQMEDVVRAFGTDEAMQQNKFLSDLQQMMREEGVMDTGHVQLAKNALSELEDLHLEMLDTEATYRAAYMQLMPQLNILKSKSDNPLQSDLSMMFVFLYNIMLLKMQKKEISPATTVIQQQVSRLLAYLSKTYKDNQDDNQTAF
ncbi:MAG: DUF4924 family protein [Paludibacteraceae bacterium]|nr:DUF4924 family protein [Paludibacteraceae bacterium]